MDSDSQLTLHKLILLYTLQRQKALTGIELSDFVIFKEYMDYFSLRQYLDELEESGLIRESSSQYAITDAGEEVINTFRTRIPHSIREAIEEYAKSAVLGRSSMLEADAAVSKAENGGYTVDCLVRDYDQLPFTFRLQAKTKAEAYAVRNNWLQKGLSLYRNLLTELRQ